MSGTQDVIVVGGGAMGLATGWALARAGARPVVLERFARGHTNGASHGATRNFNDAYTAAPFLDLLVRAHELWDELSVGLDEPLLRLHGLVTHGDDAAVAAASEAHATYGIGSEVLDPTDAQRRWPGMRFETAVLHSPGAGVVRAASALLALERELTVRGGAVRWETPVAEITEDEAGVRVRLDDGRTLDADAVVITAGAWSRALVPASFPLPPLRVTEETPAHFTPLSPDVPWPSFNHLLDRAAWPANVYGMPTPGEGVKIGFHGIGDEIDPDLRPHRPKLQDELRAYAREWFPGLDADTAVPISCTYTTTPDEAFVLDRRGRIVVGAGFSGQGFKFTPAVGETLARLALDPTASADPVFGAVR